MVMNECSACPRCGGRLKYYDSVPRLVRTKGRQTSHAPPAVLRLRGNPPGTGRSVLPLQAVRGRSDIRRTGGAYHLRDPGVRGLPLRDDHAPVAFAESTAPIMEKSISERSK